MTKRRMIHSCIWQSEHFADLTMQQRLLWIGLITNADDQGRGRAHPGLVRAAVFPFDVIAQDDIQRDIETLRDDDLLILYQADDKMYYQVIKWWEYQTPQWAYPSEYPAPDGWEDRLKYRKDNSVIFDNWIPRTLPKALPKEEGKSPPCASNDNVNDSINDKEKDIVALILETWQQLFPTKPQPRAATIKAKVKTRLTDPGFKDDWQKALRRVQPSKFCNDGGWFTLPWFLKSEEHWTNCLNGNYDNRNGNGRNNGNDPPPSGPVAEGDYVDPSEFFNQGA